MEDHYSLKTETDCVGLSRSLAPAGASVQKSCPETEDVCSPQSSSCASHCASFFITLSVSQSVSWSVSSAFRTRESGVPALRGARLQSTLHAASRGRPCLLPARTSADALPASKHTKQRDWLSLLRPSSVNIRPNGSLRFSVSLNDVGQRVDSLCRGLHFIDRTCSEGELEPEPEPALPSGTDRRAHTLNGKLAAAPAHQNPNLAFSTHTHPHLVPSFTNNYKYMLGIPPTNLLPSDSAVTAPPPPPPLSNTHLHTHHHQHSPSSNFLRLLLPFSRSSTSASLQCSELGSYASHLHIPKSSTALLEGNESGFAAEDLLGDDDVFEEDQPSPTQKGRSQLATPDKCTVAGALLAPLCYMDEDSDLDCCPSPLSEKTEPLSPYSLSGDCCSCDLHTHSVPDYTSYTSAVG
ncbi:hypothetical protein PAMP_001664 [Pampus punctatissimus]